LKTASPNSVEPARGPIFSPISLPSPRPRLTGWQTLPPALAAATSSQPRASRRRRYLAALSSAGIGGLICQSVDSKCRATPIFQRIFLRSINYLSIRSVEDRFENDA
jgi:hypothetical protein